MKKRQKVRLAIILVSFFLFPAFYYYFSPYLILDAAAQGIVNGSFVIFLMLFLTSLFLGRGFCGWLCPAAGCQESLARVRTGRVTKGNYIKWILWIPWMSAIILVAMRAGWYHRVEFFYKTDHGFSIGDLQGLITYLFVLLLIVLPALIAGRRSFCHHICWMAPFMITGRSLRNGLRLPALHLAADPEKCRQCHGCTHKCPMSLPVEAMVYANKMENRECILCGTCVDHCDQEAIRYWFK